ncbi:MAG: hypothetical protein A2987_04275 [Omnitrophica bacterium RIFCSPLOWO2_01_FULL_45_10]|nr:MAG: hypothetical protein A2987_04275 [Omnitrophica bacterium RIFCSPLOWO2_01_FULL_45_10]
MIDCAGIDLKEIEKDLRDIELDPSQINGIVITHGHEDHICKDTFKIASRYGIPIYIHHDTYQVIKERYWVKNHQVKIMHHTEKPFIINDIKIMPFKTFHSGGYVGKPFGLRIEYKHKGSRHKVGLLTDTSKVTDSMVRMLYDCKCLIIECNHDRELAQVRSPNQSTWREHLNNEAATEALIKIKNGSTDSLALKHVFLAHISERHNKPRTLINRISNGIRKENITGCDLMLTYREKRTQVKKIL